MTDRFFYHSFPRVLKEVSKDDSIEKGLQILESIKKIGLILAPEIIEWTQPTLNDGQRITYTKQVRISFTELSTSELENHGQKFGSFSIEFSVEILRKLGALPVIYMPQHLQDDKELSSVGSVIVSEIKDIKYTINQLHQLSQLSDIEYMKTLNPGATSISETCEITLQNSGEKGEIVQQNKVPLKNIESILKYIRYKNAPFELMTGVLQLVQNLICKTDDDRHNLLLDNYRQREWRLFPGIDLKDKSQTRSLTDAEKASLLKIDEKFWSKQLTIENELFRRIDQALVIDIFNGKHISELISSVIVPKEVLSRAREIFGEKVKVLD